MSKYLTEARSRATILSSSELIDEKAAAEFISVKEGTLAVWRSTGRYKLPFVKVGRNVRYRKSDLEMWLAERTRINGATA